MFLQCLCTHEICSIISAVYIHLFSLIGNNMLSSARIAFTHMVNADRQRAQPLPSPSLSLSLLPCIIALPLNLPLAATIKIKMSGLLKFKRFTLRGQKAFLFFSRFSLCIFWAEHENRGQWWATQDTAQHKDVNGGMCKGATVCEWGQRLAGRTAE